MAGVPSHLFRTINREPLSLILHAGELRCGDELTAAQLVLLRLVRRTKPADYAAAVLRDGGRPKVYYAFQDGALPKNWPLSLGPKQPAAIRVG
jgi:hypothetical protein